MRNPDNTNQQLYWHNEYKGYPVLTSYGPMIENYLAGLHEVFVKALNSHRRLLIVRLDLRYCSRFDLPFDVETNKPIQRFLRSLEAQLYHKESQRRKKGLGVHKHDMWHAWAREVGPESGIPHYHLVLFFNGDALQSVRNYSDPQAPGLYRRMHLAWARAIDVPEDLVGRPVNVAAQWYINVREQHDIIDPFKYSTYLCKKMTKEFTLGVHPFGYSRRSVAPGVSKGEVDQ